MNTVFLEIFVSCVGIVLPVFVSVYIYRNRSRDVYLKQRFEKVIFPIYNEIEPFIYQNKMDKNLKETLNNCKKIIMENQMIAGGKFKWFFMTGIDNYKKYKSFCSYVEYSYEKCCKILGIPRRTYKYLLSMNRYKIRRIAVNLCIFSIICFSLSVSFYFLTLWLDKLIN